MSKDLLWEIGMEEIPARFLPPAIEQIEQLTKDTFDEAGLDYEQMHVYATPRRLTLMIDGLSEKARDRESEVKGPAKKTAFDEAGRLKGLVMSPGDEYNGWMKWVVKHQQGGAVTFPTRAGQEAMKLTRRPPPPV